MAISLFLNVLFFCSFDVVEAFLGFFNDLEGGSSLKGFFNFLGCSSLYSFESLYFVDFSFSFLLSSSLCNFEVATLIFLISCNLSLESPLLNSRVSKNFLYNSKFLLHVICFGIFLDYLTYPVKNLGNNMKSFLSFMQGRSLLFCGFFFNRFLGCSYFDLKERLFLSPLLILGNSLINRKDFFSFFSLLIYNFSYFFFFEKSWNWFNMLSASLGKMTSFELGFFSKFMSHKEVDKFIYVCGDDDVLMIKEKGFMIYQCFFNNFRLNNANLMFPMTTSVERDSTYINMEGRFRFSKSVIFFTNTVQSDWEVMQILNFTSKFIFKSCFSSFLKFLSFLSKFFFKLMDYNCMYFFNFKSFFQRLTLLSAFNDNSKSIISFNSFFVVPFFSLLFNLDGKKFVNSFFNSLMNNYYSFENYSSNSKVLSLCSLSSFPITFV